jgi:hypothetical protein
VKKGHARNDTADPSAKTTTSGSVKTLNERPAAKSKALLTHPLAYRSEGLLVATTVPVDRGHIPPDETSCLMKLLARFGFSASPNNFAPRHQKLPNLILLCINN